MRIKLSGLVEILVFHSEQDMAARTSKAILKDIWKAIYTMGLTPRELQQNYGIDSLELQSYVTSGDLPNMGDPALYEYIVSVKCRLSACWNPHHFNDIMRAKESCDRGTTNLTYGYTEDLLFMYSIPRKAKEYRKPWFFGEVGGGIR